MSRLAFPAMILTALVALDLMVAAVLSTVAPGALVRFFDYGRSVPGKIAVWEETDRPGDLLDVAWRPSALEFSRREFAEEDPSLPVVRGYGMSFVNNILRAAREADPDIAIDLHAGPSAPPNYTYSMFLEDRDNRRVGDFAVFGILSSSVENMFSFSNSTWSFEQPAPFTYPVFRPGNLSGLTQTDPAVQTLAELRSLDRNVALSRRWSDQLSGKDAVYSPIAYGWPILDHSPFIRLLRRAAATNAIGSNQAKVLDDPWTGATAYGEVLTRMALNLAKVARADDQIPVIMMVQGRDTTDPDLLALLGETLQKADIPYFATSEYQDPRDLTAFRPDGHYRPDVDARYGEVFRDMVRDLRN